MRENHSRWFNSSIFENKRISKCIRNQQGTSKNFEGPLLCSMLLDEIFLLGDNLNKGEPWCNGKVDTLQPERPRFESQK